MRYLILSTLEEKNDEVQDVLKELKAQGVQTSYVNTNERNISACIGCNTCWLRTPGVCAVKDDYEQILIRMLQADRLLLITEAKFGFISYKMKNVVDRILPLATMNLRFKDGQMRHYPRYKKTLDVALVYKGQADNVFLTEWMERVCINLGFTSLGAFDMERKGELYYALGYDQLHTESH
ncbi:MAG: flavodoxin family protein [Lachnospiraceae bacterium]|nr:flavodoxin family protein [Lachnospiraceae bacterium]